MGNDCIDRRKSLEELLRPAAGSSPPTCCKGNQIVFFASLSVGTYYESISSANFEYFFILVLGPTQKLRRPHVMKTPKYKEIIDGFYDC